MLHSCSERGAGRRHAQRTGALRNTRLPRSRSGAIFPSREVRGSLDHCVRCGRYPHSSTLLLIGLVGVQRGGHESGSGRCAHARADSVRREGFLVTRRVRAAPRLCPCAPLAHAPMASGGSRARRWGGGEGAAGGAGPAGRDSRSTEAAGEGRLRQCHTWRGTARGPEGARATLAHLETGAVFSIQKAGGRRPVRTYLPE
jgi:hypothetical protein